AIKSGSETVFNDVLALLRQPGYKDALSNNLTLSNKYRYNTLFTALQYLSDNDCNQMLALCQQTVSTWQWQALLDSPINLGKLLSTAKSDQMGKIKLYFSLLCREFGKSKALKIFDAGMASNQCLTDEIKEKYRDLFHQHSDYTLLSNEILIQKLLTAFAAKNHDLNHHSSLQERTLSFRDVIYQDKKGKSLLWVAAYAAAFNYPQLLIKLWGKYHHLFNMVDISHREGEKVDGKSVIWFMLYACKTQPKNSDLAEIVREIWQRFPSVFDLQYVPRNEEQSTRSIAGLLKQIDRLGNDILLDLTPIEKRAAFIAQEESLGNQVITPVAGIANKYLFGATSALPQKVSELPNKDNEKSAVSICSLKQGTRSVQTKRIHRFEIDESGFGATFYSANTSISALKAKKVTFVCAGRKNNAWVPTPKEGAVIWVLTPTEYQEVKDFIPENQSALVIHKLEHDILGEFEQLGLITSRRLAIFLFAYHCDLNNFMMIDDNIEKLLLKDNAQYAECNWDKIYETVNSLKNNKVCVSVATEIAQHKTVRLGQLGSKVFFINMAMIKQKLPSLGDMFLLLPSACDTGLWGEDYYFQMMLEALFPKQGYQILPKEKITLVRSKNNRNVFLTSVQNDCKTAIAKSFSLPGFMEEILYPQRKVVVQQLNKIIRDNVERARKQRDELERVDLLSVHAKANQVTKASQVDVNNDKPARHEKVDMKRFIEKLNFIEDVHYSHQVAAIKSFAAQKETAGQMIMATGTGKTRVQCELARVAYHLASPGQTVIIVTPQLTLVEQFYKDFVRFSQTITADVPLAIPLSAIMKVSSLHSSVNVNALLVNKQIKKQKSILIFCEKSFKSFLPHLKQYNPYLCLLDEFHEYAETTQQVIKDDTSTYKLGFTATPPNNSFHKTFYRFSIEDALKAKRLAPVVIDKINRDFCADELDDFIKALPSILTRPHPCAAKAEKKVLLRDLTGVIYLPSVADCERTKEYLHNNHISCYAIHSRNTKSQEEINAFKRQRSGVLLACQMLRIGFDHSALGYVIIAQAVIHDKTLEQMIGRVMRLDGEKLGNIITFKDIARRVKQITGQLAENHAFNPDYIALEDEQSFNRSILVKKKTLKQKRLKELVTSKDNQISLTSVSLERKVKVYSIVRFLTKPDSFCILPLLAKEGKIVLLRQF
ncbi:MAG TPA: DEAD/DEAH box helicase family protein, partial [Legionella sp.]|nr:DEAD/DEAH box helicase family protein [Legionella sp.]